MKYLTKFWGNVCEYRIHTQGSLKIFDLEISMKQSESFKINNNTINTLTFYRRCECEFLAVLYIIKLK